MRIALLCLSLILIVAVISIPSEKSKPHKTPEVLHSTLELSFERSKRELNLALPKGRTLYCGCTYAEKTVSFSSCGYKIHSKRKNPARLSWEHVVPAARFGHTFVEWEKCHKKKSPRECARRNSEFVRMESDVYNLYPEALELNVIRSNKNMGEIPGEERRFGKCDVEENKRTFEPRPEIRGDIARVYFYMDQKYPKRLKLSAQERKMFQAWDQSDPVGTLECADYAARLKIWGQENSILHSKCAPSLATKSSEKSVPR